MSNWEKFSKNEQLAAIGAEIARASIWENKDRDKFIGALERALSLINEAIDDPKRYLQSIMDDAIAGETQSLERRVAASKRSAILKDFKGIEASVSKLRNDGDFTTAQALVNANAPELIKYLPHVVQRMGDPAKASAAADAEGKSGLLSDGAAARVAYKDAKAQDAIYYKPQALEAASKDTTGVATKGIYLALEQAYLDNQMRGFSDRGTAAAVHESLDDAAKVAAVATQTGIDVARLEALRDQAKSII